MTGLLIFSLALLAAVLISELAGRSVVSVAVLFLVAGFVSGRGVAGWLPLTPDSPLVTQLAELALVAVLFTDAMKLGWSNLRSAWKLPGRALLIGLPLTLLLTAVAAHYVAQVTWLDALLIGAVLSPTDPVFAEAIVGREGVAASLRHLLNVESGLNDGLALPIVLGLLAVGGSREATPAGDIGELLFGIGIGIALPWLAVRIASLRAFAVAKSYEPFFVFATGLTVFAVSRLAGANEFLAMFSAGVTMATLRPELRHDFHLFGDRVAELLKLAALLVFGALISPDFFRDIPWNGYVFAALALFLARPIGLALALAGTRLPRREKLAAMWFGPKGFASVIYGLMVLKSGVSGAESASRLIALVVTASIIAHSSTDVVVARWLGEDRDGPAAAETNPSAPGRLHRRRREPEAQPDGR